MRRIGRSPARRRRSPPPRCRRPRPHRPSRWPPVVRRPREPPAPAPEPDDELSYAKRLQGDQSPSTEKLKPAAGDQRAGAAAAEPSRPGPAVPAACACGGQADPRRPRPPPRRRPRRRAPAWPPGRWIVQLMALQDRDVGRVTLAQRLTGEGLSGVRRRSDAGLADRSTACRSAATPIATKADQVARGSRRKSSSSPTSSLDSCCWISRSLSSPAPCSRSAFRSSAIPPSHGSRSRRCSSPCAYRPADPAAAVSRSASLTGAVYFAGTLYWFVVTMTTFGGLPLALAVVRGGVAGRLSRALSRGLRRGPGPAGARASGRRALLLAPAVWVASESSAAPMSPLDFPWELLGYSQATCLPVAQVASVVGVYGLSALVALGQRGGGASRDRSRRAIRGAGTPAAGRRAACSPDAGWGALRDLRPSR